MELLDDKPVGNISDTEQLKKVKELEENLAEASLWIPMIRILSESLHELRQEELTKSVPEVPVAPERSREDIPKTVASQQEFYKEIFLLYNPNKMVLPLPKSRVP